VSLTYPHTSQSAASNSTAQTTRPSTQPTTAKTPTPTQPPTVAATTPTATHIIRAPTGQQPVVYVSNHPTLGHVGQMTGAAAQAAIALQNSAAGRGAPRIIQQPIMGVPGQVIVQTAPGANNLVYQHYQGHVAAVGQRVIYAPATTATPANVAAALPAAQQRQLQQRHQAQIQLQQAHQRQQAAQQQAQQRQQAQQPPQQQAQQRQQQAQQPPQQPQNKKASGPGGRIIQVDGANDSTDTITISPHSSSSKTQIKMLKKGSDVIIQFDGPNDSDSDDDDDEEDFDNIPVASLGGGADMEEDEGPEEEPLNSGDDVSDEEQADLFDTDNVVVCQYDKIARTRNRWKFHLKDGIMNLNSKDFVFHKGTGDAEW